MKKIFFWALVSLFLFGCQRNEPKILEDVHGLTPERIEKIFGFPDKDGQFYLNPNPLEYRYGLLKFFPEPNQILIREYLWKTNGVRRAVWFEKTEKGWSALEGIEWNSNIQF